ncbi:SET domain-containing protein [Coniochaeta ligniaria NRRL 30616]|uniref:SET domain-containing protein n=1 Tax=Coniochaeta ligniaria NRRL 30616 TaxID=1408157 RepID=A0A1J7IUP7_9PEZI|nr:SET domain-containing protein [Coniochaeta ligniaria NRRL 30616]
MDSYDELLRWATEKGVELYGVEPRKIPGRGVGMIATERLEVDKLLLEVPTSLLRTVDTIPKAVRKKLPSDMSVHGLLAADLALDKSPTYKLWNAVVPSRSELEESCPMAWVPELQAYLPSPAAERLRKMQSKFARDWEEARLAFPALTEEHYRYAWMLVNTRTFYYSTPKTEKLFHRDDRMALQPVADLFNHADEGCAVAFDQESFTIRANRTYEAGEEIFICYGRHGNDFLLAEYGFVLEENKWDEVGLDEPVLSHLTQEQRTSLEDVGFSGNYRLDAETVCYRTQIAVRRMCMPVDKWRRLVDGLEDAEVLKGKVNGLIVKLLRTYEKDVLGIIAELEGMKDGTEGQRGVLIKRWSQVRVLVEDTIRRLEAERT